MLCITVINLLNKGTICLTQKMKLCFPVLWLRWISHVEWKTALTGEKQRKCLFERWASAPCLSSHFSTSSLTPFFPPFFLPVSSPAFWSTTWAHLCTAAAMGTDKPALMKMNVPTWSPIEFHYEVYLSGAGSQAPGSVLLGSLQACCGETPAQANLAEQLCSSRVLIVKSETTLLLSVTFFLLRFAVSLRSSTASLIKLKSLLPSQSFSLCSVWMFLSLSLCVSLLFSLQPIIKKIKEGMRKSFIHPSSLWILCWSASEHFGGAVHLITALHVRHCVNQSKWGMSPAMSQTPLIIFWH